MKQNDFISIVTLVIFVFMINIQESISQYYNHHNFTNVDLYFEATRMSTKYWVDTYIYKNTSEARNTFPEDMVNNMIRDGDYEGYSKGFPGSYAFNDPNVSYIPYGCWHRTFSSGIYVNLGSNVLISDRIQLLKLWGYRGNNDRMFCTDALKRGYTYIITNNHRIKKH